MDNKNENVICQNCKTSFYIEPDDFNFYEKIKVPAPTFCPECRMKRRTNFRNARSLYKRNCDLCKKSIVTMYKPDYPAPVYCNPCWQSDQWDALSYGVDIDWSRPFFSQWHELFLKVPHYALWQVPPLQNCEYTNYSINNKDCYLSYSVTGCEDVRYSENIDKSKNCIDNLYLNESEGCYENVDCVKNYNCRYLIQSRNSIDSWFLFDCTNCQNCFMCANLRNRQYVFRGQQLTKDTYTAALNKEKTKSFESFEKLKNEFRMLIEEEAIHKYADVINSPDATGNHIQNSKNVKNSFGVFGSEDIKNGIRVLVGSKDARDVYGLAAGELQYDCMATSYNTNNCVFSFLNNTSLHDIQYCAHCLSSGNLFGCIGLQKKDYCILNKQYTKDEYHKLVDKIIEHMKNLPYSDELGRVYRYGEFFPVEFSPHDYNEAVAFDLFPITKAEALASGYTWRKDEDRTYKITIEAANLSDSASDTDKSISQEIIGCAHKANCEHKCTTAFRILPEDYDFYLKFDLPIPRLCPNCRHYDRLSPREPVEIWHRQCMCDKTTHNHPATCPNEFETSYSPDRPDKVYCESCYQKEVL